MGMFDSFKARKALLAHRKGDIAGARAAYEALYAGGCLNAEYMISWTYILLREGGEANFKKVKEILAKAQKDPAISEQRFADLDRIKHSHLYQPPLLAIIPHRPLKIKLCRPFFASAAPAAASDRQNRPDCGRLAAGRRRIKGRAGQYPWRPAAL